MIELSVGNHLGCRWHPSTRISYMSFPLIQEYYPDSSLCLYSDFPVFQALSPFLLDVRQLRDPACRNVTTLLSGAHLVTQLPRLLLQLEAVLAAVKKVEERAAEALYRPLRRVFSAAPNPDIFHLNEGSEVVQICPHRQDNLGNTRAKNHQSEQKYQYTCGCVQLTELPHGSS